MAANQGPTILAGMSLIAAGLGTITRLRWKMGDPKQDIVSEKTLEKRRYRALKKGDALYFTGLPCQYGHMSERYSSTGNCVECFKTIHREKSRRRHEQNRPEQMKKYKRKNRESWDNAANRFQKWTQEDVEIVMLKNTDGSYKFNATELAQKLRRSHKGITTARRRYAEKT